MRRRFMVDLSYEAFSHLSRLALEDDRATRDQASYLLELLLTYPGLYRAFEADLHAPVARPEPRS